MKFLAWSCFVFFAAGSRRKQPRNSVQRRQLVALHSSESLDSDGVSSGAALVNSDGREMISDRKAPLALSLLALRAGPVAGFHSANPARRASRSHIVMKQRGVFKRVRSDGKQRRPKAMNLADITTDQSLATGAPKPAASSKKPKRVKAKEDDADHVMSVRDQVRLRKFLKRLEHREEERKKDSVRFKKSKFTKPKGNRTDGDDFSDIPEMQWEWKMPILFVDGYNVAHKWPRLKKRILKDKLQECRNMLLEDVARSKGGEYNITVVFDAHESMNAGIDTFEDYQGIVQVVYAGESADEYIERETARLRAEGEEVWVASDDNDIESFCSSQGAEVMSSSWMIKELKKARVLEDMALPAFNKRMNPGDPSIWNVLPKELRDGVSAMVEVQAEDNALRNLSPEMYELYMQEKKRLQAIKDLKRAKRKRETDKMLASSPFGNL